MLNTLTKSKTAKGLAGLLSPLLLASGVYFSTPRFSHANPITDFVQEEIIDPIINMTISDLSGGKHKTYQDAVKDINPETEQPTEPCGILYLRDGTVIKQAVYKNKEFTFIKDGQKLKIPKEKVLMIDFSKDTNKDILYLRDGSVIKNVQYTQKKLEISTCSLGGMEINQDNIKLLVFGKIKKPDITKPDDSQKPAKSISDKILKLVYTSTEDGDREIYSMKSDKSDIKKLTDNTLDDSMPVLSPDQNKIAYLSEGKLCVMNADGTNKTTLQKNFNTKHISWIRWHPNNKQLFIKEGFTVYETDTSLKSANPRTIQMKVPTPEGEKSTTLRLYDIAWSPNQKESLAIFSYPDMNGPFSQIMLCDADGSVKENITIKLEKNESEKMFEKKLIADFEMNYVRKTHNENRSLGGVYTGSPEINMAWSPDGRRIALSCGPKLTVFNKNGENVDLIVTPPPSGTELKNETLMQRIKSIKWSPDSKKLAFTAVYKKGCEERIDDVAGVYIKDLEGRTVDHANSFFSDSGTISNMSWVSNDKLVYVKEMKTSSNVFTIEKGKEKLYKDNFQFSVKNTPKLEEILNLKFLASEKEVKEYLKRRTLTVIKEQPGDVKGIPVKQLILKDPIKAPNEKKFINYLNTDIPEPDLCSLDFYKSDLCFVELLYQPEQEERKDTLKKVHDFLTKKYGKPESNGSGSVLVWADGDKLIMMGGKLDTGEHFSVSYIYNNKNHYR